MSSDRRPLGASDHTSRGRVLTATISKQTHCDSGSMGHFVAWGGRRCGSALEDGELPPLQVTADMSVSETYSSSSHTASACGCSASVSVAAVESGSAASTSTVAASATTNDSSGHQTQASYEADAPGVNGEEEFYKTQLRLNLYAVTLMEKWFWESSSNPYPTHEQKKYFACEGRNANAFILCLFTATGYDYLTIRNLEHFDIRTYVCIFSSKQLLNCHHTNY